MCKLQLSKVDLTMNVAARMFECIGKNIKRDGGRKKNFVGGGAQKKGTIVLSSIFHSVLFFLPQKESRM